jgi:hypothetical protein
MTPECSGSPAICCPKTCAAPTLQVPENIQQQTTISIAHKQMFVGMSGCAFFRLIDLLQSATDVHIWRLPKRSAPTIM